MESLLTSVVNRALKRFIKRAGGRERADLRVSLSRGGVLLRNLELDLDSVVQGLPVVVHRAFARELRLAVSWTALASEPLQARGASPRAGPACVSSSVILFLCMSDGRSPTVQVVLDTVEVVLGLTPRFTHPPEEPNHGASAACLVTSSQWPRAATI